MCKVLIKAEDFPNKGFFIYNAIFSNVKNKSFTVEQLSNMLEQNNIKVEDQFIRDMLDSFVKTGLLFRKFDSYIVVYRR